MSPWRHRSGPALRGGPLPVLGVTVSVVGHVIFLGALTIFAGLWNHSSPSKVYVVNLVSGVASPRSGPLQGLKSQTLPPLPPTSPYSPHEPSELAPPKLPPLPALTKPATHPPLPTALPSLEERKPQLSPTLAEPARPRDLHPPTPSYLEKRNLSSPSASEPAGKPSEGPRQLAPSDGTKAVSAEVSDFPFAWYLRQVLVKVEQGWAKRPPISAPPGRPIIFVEILRDGSINPPRLETSSGNPFYDQAAVRAITEASPFPPLPLEWSRPTLRIKFGFELQSSRG